MLLELDAIGQEVRSEVVARVARPEQPSSYRRLPSVEGLFLDADGAWVVLGATSEPTELIPGDPLRFAQPIGHGAVLKFLP